MPSPKLVNPFATRLAGLAIIVAVVVVVALVGMRTSPATSPEPSSPSATDIAALPTNSSARTAPPSQDVPTPGTTATSPSSPPATPTSTASLTPTALPGPVWHAAANFPPSGATVTSVVAGGPGFVAMGHGRNDGYGCEELRNSRIWTTADGENWSETTDPVLAGVDLQYLVVAAEAVFLLGQAADAGCEGGYVLFKSVDGVHWEGLASNLDAYGLEGLGTGGDTLIAVGYVEGDDYDYAEAAWTSIDGINWERSAEAPWSGLFGFTHFLALGDRVVLPNDWSERPAWYSPDRGRTWHQSDFGPRQRLEFSGGAAGNGRFVMSASACCTLLDVGAGVTLVSSDGISWTESIAFAEIPEAIVALDDGFLTIGRQNWVSVDGLEWAMGPDLPDFNRRANVTAVAGASGVVVVNGDLAWFAPASGLSASGYSEQPLTAEMPEIGVRHALDLFMHCGFPEIYFGLDTWLPDPPLDDVNTPQGFDDEDRGWLTQISPDLLEYESRRGRTVTLRPSDVPVVTGPCA